jgi:hypothetical protein
MPLRIIPDQDRPSIAIEIPLEKPLPDYDLEDVEKPNPREVDGVLVSQGFRDLVDDARGVLLDILCEHHKSLADESFTLTDLDLSADVPPPMEIMQLTGAICPEDEIYRPGLWIVLKYNHGAANQPLSPALVERVKRLADEFVERMDLA